MPVPKTPQKMFETRSQAWSEVGLLHQVSPRAVKRARLEALVLAGLFVGGGGHLRQPQEPARGRHARQRARSEHGGAHLTVLVLVILGWAIARDFGRALGPALFRRLDPATAGRSVS